MLRQQLNDALKTAMLAKDARKVSTVRLILAALKDRDIAARPKGQADGIGEDEIRQMLQSMMKQRRDIGRGSGRHRRDRSRRHQGYGPGHGGAEGPSRG